MWQRFKALLFKTFSIQWVNSATLNVSKDFKGIFLIYYKWLCCCLLVFLLVMLLLPRLSVKFYSWRCRWPLGNIMPPVCKDGWGAQMSQFYLSGGPQCQTNPWSKSNTEPGFGFLTTPSVWLTKNNLLHPSLLDGTFLQRWNVGVRALYTQLLPFNSHSHSHRVTPAGQIWHTEENWKCFSFIEACVNMKAEWRNIGGYTIFRCVWG